MQALASPTYQNHLKARVVTAADGSRIGITELGRNARIPQDPLTEAINAAKLIRELWPNDRLKLCLSGGIDSFCMAEAFIKADVPFDVVVLRLTENFNFHDIAEVLLFVRERALPLDIIDIDARAFFESSKLKETAERYACSSPMLALHLHFLEKIEGCPILGGNPIRIDFLPDRFDILLPSGPHLALMNYFYLNQKPGTPFFFLFTPELATSFLKMPSLEAKMDWIRAYAQNPDLSREAFFEPNIDRRNHLGYLEKCRVYREAGFETQPKDVRKTGFDSLFRYYAIHHPELGPRAFERLFRDPLLKLFPPTQKLLHLIHKSDLGIATD